MGRGDAQPDLLDGPWKPFASQVYFSMSFRRTFLCMVRRVPPCSPESDLDSKELGLGRCLGPIETNCDGYNLQILKTCGKPPEEKHHELSDNF